MEGDLKLTEINILYLDEKKCETARKVNIF